MDGITCLEHIRANSDFKSIPVIMLTTSKQDEDSVRSYDLGANTFIQKPVDFVKFSEAVRMIHGYVYYKYKPLFYHPLSRFPL